MEMHKQFMRLCEFVSVSLTEDDAEENQAPQQGDPNAMGGDPNAMGGDQGMDPNAMGGDPNMADGAQMDPGMDGDPNAMGGDPNMADGAQMDPGMGSDPNMDPNAMGGDIPMDPGMPGGEEDEVIDVDDITNAQEKTNDKVNKVGRNLGKVDDKIVQLLQAIDKMETMINNNNAEIESFKKEFEKRNPTPTEKLNLRSLDSYPFNVNPKEFWNERGIANPKTSKTYQAYYDNNEPTTDEYEITNYDVDNFDERKIADSFHIDDDLRQTIEKIFDI